MSYVLNIDYKKSGKHEFFSCGEPLESIHL